MTFGSSESVPEPEQTAEVYEVPEDANEFYIKCKSGKVYRIKRPLQRLAPIHFSILADAVPTGIVMEDVLEPAIDEYGYVLYGQNGKPLMRQVYEELIDEKTGEPLLDTDGNVVVRPVRAPKMSPADVEKINAAYRKWATEILPHIVVPHEGVAYDTMSGEDMYGVFMAMFGMVNQGSDLFRFVRPPV